MSNDTKRFLIMVALMVVSVLMIIFLFPGMDPRSPLLGIWIAINFAIFGLARSGIAK
jgi:hypothetical protein